MGLNTLINHKLAIFVYEVHPTLKLDKDFGPRSHRSAKQGRLGNHGTAHRASLSQTFSLQRAKRPLV